MEQSNSVTLLLCPIKDCIVLLSLVLTPSHQRLYRPVILGPYSVQSKTVSSCYPWSLLCPIKDCIVLLSLVLTPSHQRLYRPIILAIPLCRPVILGPYSVPSKTVSSYYPWSLLCPLKDCTVLISLVLTLSHQRLYRPVMLGPYLTAGKSSTR